MSMLRTALKVFATHSFRMLLGCELPIRGETWKGDMGNVGAGILLLSAQVLIVVAFLGYRSKRKNAEADLIRSNERLRLAMELGKSVGWDWDIASGCETWFGDLRTFFGIASHPHRAVWGFLRSHPSGGSTTSRGSCCGCKAKQQAVFGGVPHCFAERRDTLGRVQGGIPIWDGRQRQTDARSCG